MPLSPEALFAGPCEFIMSCVSAEGEALPQARYPEVAFAGRSNVGKSSLINALTGKRRLAHASNTPGRTRELNFFLLAKRLMLVDMPGYGYAKASRKEAKQWGLLVMDYLSSRANLRRVLLLIDARHGIKDTDEMVMALLDEAAVSYMLVLTKADKPKSAEVQSVIASCEERLKPHPAALPRIIATSAVARDGLKALRAEIASFA